MTSIGGIILLGALVLVAGMARLGWLGRWWFGVALTIPFAAIMVWLELTIAGPPMWEDSYGPVLAATVLGPITTGWVAFSVFRLGRYLLTERNSAK